MGIEPYLFASSILGVVAQRLVRQICPDCKIEYSPSEKELSELGLKPRTGIFIKEQDAPIALETGYKGRHAIYELMPVSPKIKTQVLKSQDAQELRRVASGRRDEDPF